MRILIVAAIAVAPTIASGQTAMVVGAPVTNVIHMGTAIQLETRDELTTEHKALKVGQRIEMDVLQPLLLGDKVAITAGSRAVGEVTSVRNKGMWGKSGGITARLLYVEANGRQIRLNGSFNDRGETGTAGVVASVALVPVAGFFVTGTSAKIAPGTHVTGFIGEEVSVQFNEPSISHNTATGAAPAAEIVGDGKAAGREVGAARPTASPTGQYTNALFPTTSPAIDRAAFASNGVALPQGAKLLSGGAYLLPAQTASGFCIVAPREYRGSGAVNMPAITSGLPRCAVQP